jgi:DNA gyrase inhibitor GyrI
MTNKHWPYFLLVFALPLLLVFWWWGAFSTPAVENLSRPALRYAYLVSEGDYSKVEDRQREVQDLLRQQGIAIGQAITLIEDDPRTTPGSKRRAQAGIMIAENTPALKPPLMDGKLPERRALVVKSRAHPFLAYGKAYGALLDYLKVNNATLRLPIAETTQNSTLTIEMSLQP